MEVSISKTREDNNLLRINQCMKQDVPPINHCLSKLLSGREIKRDIFISLIVPTYDRFDLLKEAIESALSQSCSGNMEVVIIVDNPDIDASEVVAMVGDDERVRVYQNCKNLTLWGSMNIGTDLALGEWILYLHDDDLLKPNILASLEQLLAKADASVGCVACGAEVQLSTDRLAIRGEKSRIRYPINEDNLVDEALVPVEDDTTLVDLPKFCATFFRKSALSDIGPWDAECRGYADVAMIFAMQKKGMAYTAKCVAGVFRAHSTNTSHPSKFWDTYSLDAYNRLISVYMDSGAYIARDFRRRLSRTYISSLWKQSMPLQERLKLAKQVQKSCDIEGFDAVLIRYPVLLLPARVLYSIASTIIQKIRKRGSHHE